MILSDRQIRSLAEQGMITPFTPELIRQVDASAASASVLTKRKVISYGLSSYGYDLRLSSNDFRIFRHIPGTVVNPKAFNPDNLEPVGLRSDDHGDYFILPHLSYGLGVAIEKLKVPPNVTCIVLGKSTYARVGVIANCTPAEAAWEGHLTLEFSNSSGADCRIYANEGVVQVLFLEGEPCETSYSDRNGKYQSQPQTVITARV